MLPGGHIGEEYEIVKKHSLDLDSAHRTYRGLCRNWACHRYLRYQASSYTTEIQTGIPYHPLQHHAGSLLRHLGSRNNNNVLRPDATG